MAVAGDAHAPGAQRHADAGQQQRRRLLAQQHVGEHGAGRAVEGVAQHRGQKPPCIRSLCPHMPKAVASLVHTLLGKDPMRRGMSYRELVEQLVRLEIDTFVLPKSA